jgi:hypothetical protein
MKLRFNVVFKRGARTVHEIEGIREVDGDDITVGELGEKVIQTEQFLEKLTGLRCHINSETADGPITKGLLKTITNGD